MRKNGSVYTEFYSSGSSNDGENEYFTAWVEVLARRIRVNITCGGRRTRKMKFTRKSQTSVEREGIYPWGQRHDQVQMKLFLEVMISYEVVYA